MTFEDWAHLYAAFGGLAAMWPVHLYTAGVLLRIRDTGLRLFSGAVWLLILGGWGVFVSLSLGAMK